MGFLVEHETVAGVTFQVTTRNLQEVDRRVMVCSHCSFTREEFEEMVAEVRNAFEQC